MIFDQRCQMKHARLVSLLLLSSLLSIEAFSTCMKLSPWDSSHKQAQQHQCHPPKQPAISSLDAWVQMRSGIRPDQAKGVFSDVVFWTAEGELYEAPSGKVLARLECVETSHAVRLENNAVRVFSRKLVWFLDPETNEIITEYQGKEVEPIRYDAQVFDFEQMALDPAKGNDSSTLDTMLLPIQPYVVRSAREVPCMLIAPRWGGKGSDVLMFQVPLFIDIEIPVSSSNDDENSRGNSNPDGTIKTRRYQAWEFYDYCLNVNTIHDSDSNNDNQPPILSWMRQGSTDPFCMNADGVMHVRGHRVSSFEQLPQTSQDYVNQNYPLFRGPPKNMEEVDQLLGLS